VCSAGNRPHRSVSSRAEAECVVSLALQHSSSCAISKQALPLPVTGHLRHPLAFPPHEHTALPADPRDEATAVGVWPLRSSRGAQSFVHIARETCLQYCPGLRPCVLTGTNRCSESEGERAAVLTHFEAATATRLPVAGTA
jgi:hypothetical protein